MKRPVPFRLAGAAALTVAVIIAAFLLIHRESGFILGVPIAKEDALPQDSGELSFTLLYDGLPAPYDGYTDTYYIPQTTETMGWSGKLSTSEGFALSFAPDEFFDYRPSAIEYCHVFTLFVSDGETADSAKIMFTGLPALCLESGGEMRLFCPDRNGENGARTVSVLCEFHVRGYESELWPKKSWKLTLFDERGNYLRAQLLGMRPDDDWLLLPMYGDRTKLREKLAADIWNEIAAADAYAMEAGANAEYVEVFIDGDYAGLYLLSQRLDAKLSGGDADDTVYLFDGPDIPDMSDFELAETFFCRDVEIRSTHAVFDKSLWKNCALWTNAVFYGSGNITRVQRGENICDFYIFTTLVSASRDGFQSFCLVSHDNYGELSFVTVPTDFKFSFGCGFSELESQNNTVFSEESASAKTVCPVFDAFLLSDEKGARELLSERYAGLSHLLNSEKLFEMTDALSERLTSSGALERDGARWPESRKGAGKEELCRYIEERLKYMDAAFSAE